MSDGDKLAFVQFGDSITVGQHINPEFRWSTLVDEHLRAVLEPLGVELESHNRGISGETTRQGLERFPEDVQHFKPRLLTLQFGMNDCNCWATDAGLPRVSEGAYMANLTEMIARARHFGTEAILLLTNPRSLRRSLMASGEPYDDANARYSELMRAVAAETGTTICDVRRRFDEFSDEELASLLFPEPDLLHLSESGNAVYAEIVAQPIVDAALELVGETVAR